MIREVCVLCARGDAPLPDKVYHRHYKIWRHGDRECLAGRIRNMICKIEDDGVN